ncbi:MAG: peptidase, partial [Chloroflexi bacterium]|nr:peptidase [Chloroflexota bacterium]
LNGGIRLRYGLNLEVPGAKLFVPVEGETVAFVRPRDVGYVSMQHENVRPPLGRGLRGVPTEVSGNSPFARGIAEIMEEYGLKGEKLGIDTLEAGPMLDLVQAGLNLVDAEPTIEHAWTVKTDDEIVIYREVGRQYIASLTAFRDAVRPGITEKELADIVTVTWLQSGGEDIAQLNVCAGENMNPWRRWPTNRKLREGEFVGVDLHGRGQNGMRGDSSTTFLVGDHPTAEQKDLYKRAYDYIQASIPVWRAGRTIAEAMADVPQVPDRFREKLWDLNYAHGVGMGSSGYPHMDPRRAPTEDVLYRNQMLSVECYFGEKGGSMAVKLEQQIALRDGEPEVIGPIPMDERFL